MDWKQMSHLSVSLFLFLLLTRLLGALLTLVLPLIIISDEIRRLNVPKGNFYGRQSECILFI